MKTKEIKKEALVSEVRSLKRRFIGITCISGEGKFTLYYHFDMGPEIFSYILKTSRKEPVPTIMRIFPSAEIYEREVHDLFGVEFEGNEFLHLPLVLPDDFKGRKPMEGEENA